MPKKEVNLAIDIGNSNIHIAVFYNDKIIKFYTIPTPSYKSANRKLNIISRKYNVKLIGISNVVPRINSYFSKNIINIFKTKPVTINYKTKLPVRIKVKNPVTLGADRICNAVYGYIASGKKLNTLIIDLGTANKFDLVLKNGDYVGGIIAPGLITSSKALNLNTGKLPFLNINALDLDPVLIGKNTFQAIQSGLLNYMYFAAEGIIKAVKKQYPGKLNIILGGGSAVFVKRRLSQKYIFNEHTVLNGINCILNYQ